MRLRTYIFSSECHFLVLVFFCLFCLSNKIQKENYRSYLIPFVYFCFSPSFSIEINKLNLFLFVAHIEKYLGAIYVVDELDYERRQHYELVIRATDSVSGVSAEVPVSVLIQDVNDCLPEFEMDNYNVTVSEGASFGTAILKVTAHDNDTGVNQLVTYAIQTDNKNTSEYFQMDPLEGVVYLKKPLDHEQLAAHHFTVIATDKGIPSLSSTAHVWIRGQLVCFL